MNQMRNYFGGNQDNGGPNLPGPFGNAMAVISKFTQFMTNPIGAMLGSGINIPSNIQDNPEAITNYLRSSGMMSENQFNQASQLANWAQNLFGKRL